jgi:hypothetical protein
MYLEGEKAQGWKGKNVVMRCVTRAIVHLRGERERGWDLVRAKRMDFYINLLQCHDVLDWGPNSGLCREKAMPNRLSQDNLIGRNNSFTYTGVSKRDLQRYSKCYCATSVTKTFSLHSPHSNIWNTIVKHFLKYPTLPLEVTMNRNYPR